MATPRLRVAFAAFEPFPNAKGSGTRIGHMLRGLVEQGHEVHLLSLPPSAPLEPLPDGVTYHPLRAFDDNFLRRAQAFENLVARKLISLQPQVVHVRGIFEGRAARRYCEQRPKSLLVAEVNGLPSVELAFHYPNVANARGFLRQLKELETELLERADGLLTQSYTTLRFCQRRGRPQAGLNRVISNGASPLPLSEVAADKPVVLYQGSFAPWQGVRELMSVCRRLLRRQWAELWLIGPARKRWQKELLRHERALGLRGRIRWLGAVGRHELPRLIDHASVCVAPLRADERNVVQGCNPIKLFEYLERGKPVIASRLPCTAEIIHHRHTGLLLPPDALGRWQKALESAVLDSPRWQRLGAAGRQYVHAHGLWRHRRASLKRFYAELLEKRARA